jgi:pantetheine-phosphate adenylyltransferase
MKIAVFPGSFDPVTKGHENIIQRALPLFDQVVIGIGYNSEKKYLFTEEKRKQFIEKTFGDEKKIRVMSYKGLTVDFCKVVGAQYILRGLRTSADFEFDWAIGQMNHSMVKGIETVFLLSEPGLSHIASTIVRDILRHKGDASVFVPDAIRDQLML